MKYEFTLRYKHDSLNTCAVITEGDTIEAAAQDCFRYLNYPGKWEVFEAYVVGSREYIKFSTPIKYKTLY